MQKIYLFSIKFVLFLFLLFSSTFFSQTAVTLRSDLSGPYGLAVDGAGNIFVADMSGNAIRKVSPDGSTMTTLGSGFNQPMGVAVDASGNIYVSDSNNNSIKKMDANGGNITTLVNTGLNKPSAIYIDNLNGLLYFCDTNIGAVKKMTLSGANLTTVATGLSQPTGIGMDSSGNLYVGTGPGNTVTKIAPNGTKTNIGSGLSLPRGIAIDSFNNVYVAESGNSVVRRMSSSGANITAVTNSSTGSVFGVALDNSNVLYWVSYSAKKLYKLSSSLGVKETFISSFNITPNPANELVELNNIGKGEKVNIFDLTGKLIFQTTAQSTSISINTSGFQNGLYLIKVGSISKKLVISH